MSFEGLLPGTLLKLSEAMPDVLELRHVTSESDPWRDVHHDDVFLVISSTPALKNHSWIAPRGWPMVLTVLHMRTDRLMNTNEITFWWLEEVR